VGEGGEEDHMGYGRFVGVGTEESDDIADVNSLDTLPDDTGVFDLVHIRFLGLAIPEPKWGDLLEEASRILKSGGKLEIVEMSYTLPTSAPSSLRNSFASLLLANLVQPLPVLPI